VVEHLIDDFKVNGLNPSAGIDKFKVNWFGYVPVAQW
jgi:hypothetical protein